jgi:hypothetical protein
MKVYGVPPEQVIGSSIKVKFEMHEDKPVLVRLPELDFFDDKEGKPVAINQYIGRRPIAAFGNSDGDLQMLQWTTAGEGRRFALYIHHTDAEREWAYDRKSSIGRLDKGLEEAKAKGWTVVDMKQDWKLIYPFEKKSQSTRTTPRIRHSGPYDDAPAQGHYISQLSRLLNEQPITQCSFKPCLFIPLFLASL